MKDEPQVDHGEGTGEDTEMCAHEIHRATVDAHQQGTELVNLSNRSFAAKTSLVG